MAGFGELVLVLGDLHIHQRSREIPEKFKRMLVPNKMQHIICTGNMGSHEQYDMLRNLAPNVHTVSGNFEGKEMSFPETKVVQVGDFRIGVIHGHQIVPQGDHMALATTRRKLDVDILVSGNTHRNEVAEYDGHFHINPGSITGSFSSTLFNVIPSFVLLAVQGSKAVCYVYELINDELSVSKTEFNKNVS
mmetsp:Transcript_8949/g.12734  ORF Transcript_8949/g.12734 Transcript_8949/m.12734 type:complete len:191 (+) Transcript_8949:39-611(+)